MSIQEVSAEELARLFHLYHEALAHGFEQPATQPSRDAWGQLPQRERKSMVAAARLALLDLAAAAQEKQPTRPYFAKPGEADWGC